MLIYDNVTADKYVIMPDHVPLIIFIASDDNGRTKFAPTFCQGDYSFDLHLIHDMKIRGISPGTFRCK